MIPQNKVNKFPLKTTYSLGIIKLKPIAKPYLNGVGHFARACCLQFSISQTYYSQTFQSLINNLISY